jgi:hypothetical protein
MPGPGTWSPGDVLTAADLNDIGTWDTYSPTLAQNGTRTCTVNYASYVVINKFCQVNLDLTCTTSGSAANVITVSLPFTAATNQDQLSLGGGIFYDDSATDVILVTPVIDSTTTVRMMSDATTSRTGGLGASPSLALANGDVISLSFQFRVA